MNPVAIVTGASRGIGRAVAAGLAQDGFELALIARGRAELEQLVSELPDDGGRVHSAHVVDVADPEAIEVEMAGMSRASSASWA